MAHEPEHPGLAAATRDLQIEATAVGVVTGFPLLFDRPGVEAFDEPRHGALPVYPLIYPRMIRGLCWIAMDNDGS